MSLRTVKLDTIRLVNSAEKLKLCVSSTADIRMDEPPGNKLNQTGQEISYADVMARDFWICRDVVCMEVKVLFNGKPFNETCRLRILEGLGYGIRDAQLWSILALSPSLDTSDISETRQGLLSIKINPNVPISSANSDLRPWFLRNVDVRPAKGVPCAKLEKICIKLDFLTLSKKTKSTVKRNKVKPVAWEPADEILLDVSSKPDSATNLEDLEEAVASLKSLSESIASCFNQGKHEHPHLDHNVDAAGIPAVIGRRGATFSKAITEVLKDWLSSRLQNPQRTETDIIELMQRTGLQRGPLTRSLKYYEKRLTRQAKEKDEPEMLLSAPYWSSSDKHQPQAEDEGREMLLLSDTPQAYHDKLQLQFQSMSVQRHDEIIKGSCVDDDMLLPSSQKSPSTIFTRPGTPQSFSFSGLSIISLTSSGKRPAKDDLAALDTQNDIGLSIDTMLMSKLTDIALRTLVVGDSTRYQRALQGVALRKPHPETLLTELAPALFSPGFNESMARNSHFLPRISYTISTTLLENVQSPSLKAKLMQLASIYSTASSGNDEYPSIRQRLSSAVQSRLWSIMQRNLYDPTAPKDIWRKARINDDSGDENFPELLSSQEEPLEKTDTNWVEEGLFDSDFDDLLECEEDELLLDYTGDDDSENAIAEKELNEMLFGNVLEDVVSDDEFLLLGGSEENSMLV